MIIKLYHLKTPVVNIQLQWELYDRIYPSRNRTGGRSSLISCRSCLASFHSHKYTRCPRCDKPKKFFVKGCIAYGVKRAYYGKILRRLWGKPLIAVPVSLEIYSILGNGKNKDRDDDQIGNLAFGLVSEHLIVDDHLIWKHSVTKLFSSNRFPMVNIYLDFHEPNFLDPDKPKTPEYFAAMDTLTKYYPGQKVHIPKSFTTKLDKFNSELKDILYSVFPEVVKAGNEYRNLIPIIRKRLPQFIGVRDTVIRDLYREYRKSLKGKE